MEINKLGNNIAYIVCPECHGESYLLYNNIKSIHADRDYDIFQCEKCAICFTHPFGIPKKYYSEEEYGYERIKAQFKEKEYRNKFYSKLIKKYARDKLLEIGSMFGLLLNKLQSDYNVFGIELGETPCEEMKKKGINYFNGTIEEFTKVNKIEFDTVVAMHVIEHTDNVKSFIRSIKYNLCKDGTLILAFPNFDRSHRLKQNWGWNLVPAHQYHFNEKYMENLLNKFDLEVLEVLKKGGDSAFYLSCLYNILNRKKGKLINPILAKIIFLITFYLISKPLFHLRKDEIIIVAKNRLK